MNAVLVTGATGCIGSNLTVELLNRGQTIRAFHRSQSNNVTLKGVNIEHYIGDVRDKEAVRKAMVGCATVFHTAAIVSFERRRRAEQFDINVNGTRNIVEACLELGVKKLIHTSSVAALGHKTEGVYIDEGTEYDSGTDSGYRYSKHRSELEVLHGVARGLHAVILNPSVVIGPRDVYIHGGQIVRDSVRGRIRVYVAGGINVVGVRDVVAGHLAAAEKGKKGERYILGGQNMTFKELFDLAARILGGRAPIVKMPGRLAKGIGHAAEYIAGITGTRPWITSEMLATIGTNKWYSIEKAKRELGYEPRPIEEAMLEAYHWYRDNGML
jgi:dihydroflavonol-4-reductase